MIEEFEVVAEVDLSRGTAKARTVDIDAPEPEPTAFEGAKKRLLDLLKGKDRDFAAQKQEILARHERELEAFNEAKAAAIEKARLTETAADPGYQARMAAAEAAAAERRAGVEVLVLLGRILKSERKKSNKVTHLEINKALGEIPWSTMPEVNSALSFFLTTLERLSK